MYTMFWQFLVVVGSIISFFIMFRIRASVKKGEIDQSHFSRKEKTLVWLLVTISPLVSGAIFYYGLRKRLPQKAKAANLYSLVIFLAIMTVSVFAEKIYQ